MFRRLGSKIGTAFVLLFFCLAAGAQTDGTYSGYSPYSIYGIGQLHQSGTAYNRGMGGVGIANRTRRFINTQNPASVTARDSLSFMADFGLAGRTSLFSEGSSRNICNTINIDDFVLSFPLWRHTAMMVGLSPFSDMGYKVTDSSIDPYAAQKVFSSSGNGGVYQLFAAFGVTLWSRLSLGVQYNHYFGNLNKVASTTFSDETYIGQSAGDSLQVRGNAVKFGLQWEQPVSVNSYLTLGATYRLSTRMRGHTIEYSQLGDLRPREYLNISDLGLRFGNELGVGLAWRKADIWSVEADYTFTDWTTSEFENVHGFSNNGIYYFSSSAGQTFRLGFDLTPNRNDIRYYFKRCTYRGGAYFDQSYYLVDGKHINTVGLTLGMTFPVYRWYNGVSVGLELGQRGVGSSLVKENYLGFNIGFNIFDIWFQKPHYE